MKHVALVLVFWAIPNGPAPWWYGREYDLCMITTPDDHDWDCEVLLPAVGE